MRISKVWEDQRTVNELRPDKVRKNNGIRRLYRDVKKSEAEERNDRNKT